MTDEPSEIEKLVYQAAASNFADRYDAECDGNESRTRWEIVARRFESVPINLKPVVLFNLARISLADGDFERAQSIAKQASDYYWNADHHSLDNALGDQNFWHANVLQLLSQIQEELKIIDGAELNLRMAIAVYPAAWRARKALGALLLNYTDDYSRAFGYICEAVEFGSLHGWELDALDFEGLGYATKVLLKLSNSQKVPKYYGIRARNTWGGLRETWERYFPQHALLLEVEAQVKELL